MGGKTDELAVGIRYYLLDEIDGKINSVLEQAIKKSKNLETEVMKSSNVMNGMFDKVINKFDKFKQAGKKSYSALNKEIKNFKSLQEEASKKTNKVTDGIKRMVLTFLSLAAIKKGIDLSSDFGETLGKLNDVFGKSTIPKINREIDMMNYRLRVSKSDLTAYYADSGALFKGIGLGMEEAFNTSTETIQTALDLASFHNLDNKRAINAVKSAILGEAEALKSATGIVVMDTTMAEYAKKIKKDWSKMNIKDKSMLRLQYIVENKDKQGAKDNLYKTKDSFSNISKAIPGVLKDNSIAMFSSLTEELSSALITTYGLLKNNQKAFVMTGKAIGMVVRTGINFLEWLGKSSTASDITKTAMLSLIGVYGIYKTVVGVATMITSIQNLVIGKDSALALFKSSAAIIKNTVVTGANKAMMLGSIGVIVAKSIATQTMAAISLGASIATKTLTITQWALNTALAANPIGVVVGGLVLLGGAMYMAYKRSETFRNIVGAVFKGLKIMFDWITGKTVFSFFKSLFMGDSKKEIILTEKKAIEQVNTEKSDSKTKNRIEMIDKKNDIPKYAKGTKYARGGLSLVGEEGPELIDLPRGSKVFDTAKTNKIIKGNNAKYNTSNIENMTNNVINNENSTINNSKTINDIKNYSTIRELISKEKSTKIRIIPNFIKPSYQKVEEREDKKSTKKDKGYIVMIEGSKYEFNFSGPINSFEDIKDKLEKWLDKRERRTDQKLRALLGGV